MLGSYLWQGELPRVRTLGILTSPITSTTSAHQSLTLLFRDIERKTYSSSAPDTLDKSRFGDKKKERREPVGSPAPVGMATTFSVKKLDD